MAASFPEPSTSLSTSNRLGDSFSTELFDYPDADIVLRSCDSQDFRVQKVFLVKSSPLLDRFIEAASDHSSPTLPVGNGTPLPVVQLSERGTILYNLLTFLLPVAPVLPLDLEETMELLSVAQTYEMSHVLVHIRGSIALKRPPLINTNNALRVYSLAQKYGLHPEIVDAARITVRNTLTIENLKCNVGMMPGSHLYALWKYHRCVQDNLVGSVDRFRRACAHSVLKGMDCERTSSDIPKWIDDYIVQMAYDPSLFDFVEFQSALARHVGSTVTAEDRIARLGCLYCADISRQTMVTFWTAVAHFFHSKTRKASMGHVNHIM
jgi:hypothetical protein